MGSSHAIAFLIPLAAGCVIITGDQERQREIVIEDTGENEGSEQWVQVATGGLHSCGLRDNGIVECWGKDDKGQSSPPTDARFDSITLGDAFSCGLQKAPNAGVPRCWGDSSQGIIAEAPAVAFQKIAAGGFHVCGLQLDGTALCWGRNDDGQSNVVPGEVYIDIAAGRHHSCAVRQNGTLYCWGENDCQQTVYPGGDAWKRVYAGFQYSCALDTAGEIECWGSAEAEGCFYKEDTLTPPATDPEDLDEPWVYEDMSAGPFHACAQTTRQEVFCWGSDSQGATDVDDDYLYVNVSAGGSSLAAEHTCSITTGNDILCVGYDVWGQCSPPVDPDDVADDTGKDSG
jgi:alpha-tubulin suppressor-like RCC1 family protein